MSTGPISNADRLMMILREKLRERAKAADKPTRRSETPPPSGVRAVAAVQGADDRQLRRAFIQALLVEQIGPALINDARFQEIVSRVTSALDEDEVASALLGRVVQDLRNG